MSVASEYERAEQVVADVALLHDMAAGRLDEQRVKEAAQVLLEHRRWVGTVGTSSQVA